MSSKVVLGGGLGGLSAAYYLLKTRPTALITLIESSQRTGGWIQSNHQRSGLIFEQGPRTIRPRGEAATNTLELVEDLGLGDKIVPISSHHPAAQKRLIYANGETHLLPSSLGGLFRTRKPFTKPLVLHLMNDLWARKKSVGDESIYDFAERRFGPEVADYLISPMICGICAGNAREVSVKFLMKSLFEYEQESGSISMGIVRKVLSGKKTTRNELSGLALRAKNESWSIYSFVDGCETLPKAIRSNIVDKGATIKLGTRCDSIEFSSSKEGHLCFDDGTKMTANRVVSSLPASALAPLVKTQHPTLSNLLDTIRSVTVGVVNLHYDTPVLPGDGFGVLVAPKEKLPILGIIYDSCCFPRDDNGTVLTVMVGGHWFEHYFGASPTQDVILDAALSQLKHILKIDTKPVDYKVNILDNCIPQYLVGHDDNVQKIEDYIRDNNIPLSLCGASYYGVGINDVILSAKRAVEKID